MRSVDYFGVAPDASDNSPQRLSGTRLFQLDPDFTARSRA
jgi:hypothetical protein